MNGKKILTVLALLVLVFILWGHFAPHGYKCHTISTGAVHVCL